MTDFDLLRGYTSSGSEDDFAALVDRYANLVYSAALRQTRDPEDAAEITQAVFTILARKAGAIRKDTVLSGWLLRTTRLVALNALRREVHRRRTDREAMNLHVAESESAWKQIAPLLDEALLSLNDRDRDAVVLRYFEQKSFKEIGKLLRTSENNAQKRVSRAVDKLRKLFVKRGVVVPSTIVFAAITANAVQAAPGHLAASAVGAATSGSTAAAGSSALAKTTLAALKEAQLRNLVLKVACLALVLALALLALFLTRTASNSASGPGTANLTPATAPPKVAEIPIRAQAVAGQLRLQVIDSQTGLPIRNARATAIQTSYFRHIPSSQTNFVQTDILGECLIPFGFTNEEDWNLLIEIIKDGYIPRFVSWNELRGDLIEDIPTAYTVRLDHGVTIGGFAVGGAGETVPGATIAFSIPNQNLPGTIEGPPEREGLAMEHTEVTDAQGRWFCNHVPTLVGGIKFYLSHPDYLSASFDVPRLEATLNSGMDGQWEENLRNQKAVVILKPGLVVTGVVTDEDGEPVSGGQLFRDRVWDNSETIGADGRFRIGNAWDRDLVLTVVADGYQAKDMTVRPASITNEVRFVMPRAAMLRGQVIDQSGKPILNATVVATGGDFNNGRFHWGTQTDEEGRFEWRSAPPMQKLYSGQAAGYESLSGLDLVPDGVEHVITLHEGVKSHRLRISGNAVDSKTRNPVDAFEVWDRSTFGPAPGQFGAELALSPTLRTTGTAGKFSFMTSFYSDDAHVVSYAVEIRATGYLPATRVVPRQLSNDYQVEFALTATPALTGSVQSPDGQPAVGAVVLLCAQKGDLLYMRLPGQIDLQISRGNRVETGTNGAFSLPMTSATGTVCIANNSGYSQVPIERLAAHHTVKLDPWGQVAGSLMIGGMPGADEEIRLDSLIDDGSPSQVHLITKTDANGHFVFEGVPPGDRKISHHLRAHDRRTGGVPLTESVSVAVKSGQVGRVVLGAAGRKVVGRVGEKESSQRIDWRRCSLGLAAEWPGRPAPSRASFTSDAEYLTAINKWQERKGEFQNSEAGRQAPNHSREYITAIEADGSFALSDVIPGAYELRIIANHPTGVVELGPSQGTMTKFHELMGLVDGIAREVIVPDADDGDSKPLDLGLWEITLKNPSGGK
jgi:RNA polymerase sigma factor (sigma-70 family)